MNKQMNKQMNVRVLLQFIESLEREREREREHKARIISMPFVHFNWSIILVITYIIIIYRM